MAKQRFGGDASTAVYPDGLLALFSSVRMDVHHEKLSTRERLLSRSLWRFCFSDRHLYVCEKESDYMPLHFTVGFTYHSPLGSDIAY